MAKSNKAPFWSLFAAGGTVAAFAMPALVVITLMAGHGHMPPALNYDQLLAFADNWLGKLALLLVISLSLWHAAHRMRTAMHGLGLRADRWVALTGYGIAAVGTLLSIHYLLKI